MSNIINRGSQLIHRNNDPFSPLKVDISSEYDKSTNSLFGHNTGVVPNDSIFNGVEIKSKMSAAIWKDENIVHRAMSISENINSTRFMLGRQVIAIRDDINLISYALAVESDALILVSMVEGNIRERKIIFQGFTQRAH